jgi:hypothetical protein
MNVASRASRGDRVGGLLRLARVPVEPVDDGGERPDPLCAVTTSIEVGSPMTTAAGRGRGEQPLDRRGCARRCRSPRRRSARAGSGGSGSAATIAGRAASTTRGSPSCRWCPRPYSRPPPRVEVNGSRSTAGRRRARSRCARSARHHPRRRGRCGRAGWPWCRRVEDALVRDVVVVEQRSTNATSSRFELRLVVSILVARPKRRRGTGDRWWGRTRSATPWRRRTPIASWVRCSGSRSAMRWGPATSSRRRPTAKPR